MFDHYDIIIIGSGAGGGTLAFGLAHRGLRILLLERGHSIPKEPENWQARSLFQEGRYRTDQQWIDQRQRQPFRPSLYQHVGGSTKVYGAALLRMREMDFGTVTYPEGISPAWPLSYGALEPYYAQAEDLYWVHGDRGEDPTEPFAHGPFPFPAMPHEPKVWAIAQQLSRQGLQPFSLPMGIDRREGGSCIRCSTCDGYPCLLDAKADAEVCCVEPALAQGNVTLKTGVEAQRIITEESGRRVVGVEAIAAGRAVYYKAHQIVVACGAVNSAALLLRSATAQHPRGLGNSSGLVGRYLMKHNVTKLFAIGWENNPTVFQKTLAINDFYRQDGDAPIGHIHLMGKHTWEMMRSDFPEWVPNRMLQAIARRSVDWWVQTEDLPDPENRVTLTPRGEIAVTYRPNNLMNHHRLTQRMRSLLRGAGFPWVIARPVGLATLNHQAGTCRFGEDPKTSVLNLDCRCHDLENLYVVDSSFFPSATATNPTLTIAANALRVAERLACHPVSMPAIA
ncbi:GMC oxidoreductase [Lyngbya confervoides]|uniref:GMC family oxidoreductase n=1 Tax=Lyngbya confervoides BDU141951 TaxID=1574623 RepID=A0ABD4SZ57_9CYAN|nr:GMC family oxidoreductase [Lyngbya confervoides]MCM1981706.1 GMC family oxidoreductase [Lyngbya confervoides BDU141951]